MPFISRDEQGRIAGIHRERRADGEQPLDMRDPEALAFLGCSAEQQEFLRLDAAFVRVIEDVIDVLMAKNLMTITDLPPEAQTKLFARRSHRVASAREPLRLFADTVDAELVATDFAPLA